MRIIDDWFSARPMGLIFECKVGKGKLLNTGVDLLKDQSKRPGARQLLYSLKNYMAGNSFNPSVQVEAKKIRGLIVR